MLQEYSKAVGYTKVLLQVEPGNRQVQVLKDVIEKRMERGMVSTQNTVKHVFIQFYNC